MRRKIELQVLVVTIFLVFSPGELLSEGVADLPDLILQSTEKSHTEIVTKSLHVWQIHADSGTPVENQYVQIEVSEGTCRNPVLGTDKHVNFSSLEAIVKDVTTPEMSEEEKAIALWRFVMENCYLGRIEYQNKNNWYFCMCVINSYHFFIWNSKHYPSNQ